MKTILITGIGGDIGQSIATIVREEYPGIQLIGTDISLEHAGSIFVDIFIKIPMASSPIYLESIRSLMSEHSVDIIIPTSEQELSVFAPLIDEFGGNRCITAGIKVIDIGIDKFKTNRFISSLGIPAPWTVLATKESPLKFPCIFKAQSGSGSKNIFNVDNQEEADFLVKKYPNSVFQELLEPAEQEVTCAVYRSKNGEVAVVQLLRKLMGDATGWAKVVYNNEILEMCKKIAIGMDLYGSMNIQLRVTELGPRVFEINPRFSSTVLMRHRLGFCDLLWALKESQGLPFVFPNIEIGQCIVRTQYVKKIDS